MTKRNARIFGALVVIVLAVVFVAAAMMVEAQQGGTTHYFYDENGRLTSVISPSGQVAIYQYDAAGNIVSISRQDSTLVLISGFSPDSGQVGTQVTITGTGFGATASQNTVQFNGVSANIVSATTTQIVTIVPTGATTGPIRVIMPTGSGISSTPFNLLSLAPVITGFTPAIATPGTSVTITGINFDSSPNLNTVKFNGKQTPDNTSATATTIVTKVPIGATSGRISVTTANGTAISNGDFFVPPPPRTAADVRDTGRIAVGQDKTISINQSGKIALVVFDGIAGQQMNVRLSNITIRVLNIFIFNPNGTQRAFEQFSPEFTGINEGLVDTLILPATGTYTIMIFAFGEGSATLSLLPAPPDVTASITPGGPPVAVTIASPGQNARLTFTGTENQRVSLKLTDTTILRTKIVIIRPNSGLLFENIFHRDERTEYFSGPIELPVTGTYTILLDPFSFNTGTMTVSLFDVPADLTGTIIPGGPTVTLDLDTPGQIARLTFDATQGQRLSVTARSSTIAGANVEIITPTGQFLCCGDRFADMRNGNEGCVESDFFMPVTGTYTLLVIPDDPDTAHISGSMTVTLHNASTLNAGTLTVGGPPVTVNVVPAQTAILQVEGTFSEGQEFTIQITNNTIGCVEVLALTPDGFTVAGTADCGSSFGFQTFPEFSTPIKIVIDPEQCNRGSITVRITSP